jgi:hypothetical protein
MPLFFIAPFYQALVINIEMKDCVFETLKDCSIITQLKDYVNVRPNFSGQSQPDTPSTILKQIK